MLQSRSSYQTRAENLSNSPSPSSRLGGLFLPFGKNSVMPLVGGSNLLLRPVELGSIDPHSLGQKQALWERPLVAQTGRSSASRREEVLLGSWCVSDQRFVRRALRVLAEGYAI
jgi:hypothetical protein